MKYFKKGKLVGAISLALVLSGCGKEAVPEPENTAPSVTVQTSISINEGDAITIPYSVTDAEQSGLKVSIYDIDGNMLSKDEQGTMSGTVTLNPDDMSISYSAPWLDVDKSFNEAFVVRVSDGEAINGYSEQRVDVSVADINSPVKIKVNVPSAGYGYQNTQTDTDVNFWYAENAGEVTLQFDLDEQDADAVDVSFDLNEGVIFKNQITSVIDGDKVILTFTPPNITTIYEDVVFSLSVTDNDDTSVATASMTLVNKPVLTWESKSSASISERDGGALYFTSSEVADYPGDYKVELTDSKTGQVLKFDPGLTFSAENGVLQFSNVEAFDGNQQVNVKVTLSNVIPHLGGETYTEETVLEKSIVFIDDEDDDFDAFITEYNEYKDKALGVIEREDEVRLSKAFSDYLYLNRHIKESEALSFYTKVKNSLSLEAVRMNDIIDDVSKSITDNEEPDVIREKVAKFEDEFDSYGDATRKVFYDEFALLTEGKGLSLPLSPPVEGTRMAEYLDSLSHYIGNLRYGAFSGAENAWVFSSQYKYMDVIDYTDPYCLNQG